MLPIFVGCVDNLNKAMKKKSSVQWSKLCFGLDVQPEIQILSNVRVFMSIIENQMKNDEHYATHGHQC